MIKSAGERRLEAATWGLLLVWLGATMTFRERPGLTGVVGGGILIVSALLQKAAGWQAGSVLWVAGIALVISGLNELIGDRDVPVFAVVLIILGALIVVRAVSGRPRARGAGSERKQRSGELE